MTGYSVLPDSLDSVVRDLEDRVRRLSTGRNVSQTVTVSQNLGQYVYSSIAPALYTGTTVYGTAFVLQASGAAPNAGTSVEVRYYQQVPRIYTDAQIVGGTDYTVLGNTVWIGGSIIGTPVIVPFTFSCAISDDIRGTYGFIEVLLTAAALPTVEPVITILWAGFEP